MPKLYPIIIVILLGTVSGYYLFGPKEIYLRHNCDLQKKGECTVLQDDMEFIFTMNPTPIIPTEDVSYTLKAKGADIEKVTLRILGHDMEMPRDEQVFNLESFMKKDQFSATRTFPVCTEKLMTWRLYYVIKAHKKWIRTTFDLLVRRPQ